MKRITIQNIKLRNVLNSCGNFCIEAELLLSDGSRVHESSPTGTTTGKYDAKLISLNEAVSLLPVLQSALIGLSVEDQVAIDKTIAHCLGHQNNRIYGANLSSAISMAVCRAAAISHCIPLYQHIATSFNTTSSVPQLIVNVLNGGAHAGNELPITEFMLVTNDCTAKEAVEFTNSAYHQLRNIIKNQYGSSGVHVGLEGGFAPSISDSEQAIELLTRAITEIDKSDLITIGIDIAASNLFDPQTGQFKFGNTFLTIDTFISYLASLSQAHSNIVYFEDPLAEDQAQDWARLKQLLPGKLIAGDDLVSTDSNRLMEFAKQQAINAIVLKINQCGTVSELANCVSIAKSKSLVTIMSHRSCETDSDFLTNMAIGLSSDYLKAGACARERIIKYNSLLRTAESF